jgi:hypothetical protein
MLFDSEQKALKLQAGHGFIQFVDDYSMPDWMVTGDETCCFKYDLQNDKAHNSASLALQDTNKGLHLTMVTFFERESFSENLFHRQIWKIGNTMWQRCLICPRKFEWDLSFRKDEVCSSCMTIYDLKLQYQ